MKRVMTLFNGIIIAICSFGIIINLLHFTEIRYSRVIDFDTEYNDYVTSLNKVNAAVNKININNYHGTINKVLLTNAKTKLQNCLVTLRSAEVLKYKGKQRITIKDIDKMYDSYKTSGCQSELEWFYSLNENEIGLLKLTNMTTNLEDITLLETVALSGVEEDIYRVNYYYLYYPLGYVNRNYLTDSLLWDYSDIMYIYKATIDTIQTISNLLLQEIGGIVYE